MNESPEINAASMHLIDEHLDAVEATLARGGITRNERRRIIDELEVQIHDMLAARGESPTEQDIRELLARLDPPQAYAASSESAVAHEQPFQAAPPLEQKFSMMALVGAIWAPFFLLGFLFLLVDPICKLRLATGQIGIREFICIIGLLAPFGTTILGWVAVSQIRHSRGRIYGLGLALFAGLFFPLILLNGLIALFGWILFTIFFADFWRSIHRVLFFTIDLPILVFVWYILDRLVILDSLRRARKPL